jgi:hypothetical protein
MSDKFANLQAGLDSPAEYAVEVSPSNSEDLGRVSRGLYSGSGGVIVIVDKNGNESIWRSVPAGVVLPVRVSRVRASSSGSPTESTTATGLIALS